MLRYSVVFAIGSLLLCFGVILGMLISLSNGQRELMPRRRRRHMNRPK